MRQGDRDVHTAIRFAEEGADIIAFDLCEQMPTVPYPMSGPEDLDETVNLIKKPAAASSPNRAMSATSRD